MSPDRGSADTAHRTVRRNPRLKIFTCQTANAPPPDWPVGPAFEAHRAAPSLLSLAARVEARDEDMERREAPGADRRTVTCLRSTPGTLAGRSRAPVT